jgi:hypothetical protein
VWWPQAVSAESEQYPHRLGAPTWQEQLHALQRQQAAQQAQHHEQALQQQLAFGGLGGFSAGPAKRQPAPASAFGAGPTSFAQALQQQLAQAAATGRTAACRA